MPAGATIGAYTIVTLLDRGATGDVYQVTGRNHAPLALKILRSGSLESDAGRRFLRDADKLIPLRHRNIVTVIECGLHEDVPFLVMERLFGQTLSKRMQSGARITASECLDIAIQMCDGLQHAHDYGVVHRDVKPANVWIQLDGGVKLLDFGLAHFDGSTLTRAGDVLGTAAYMSTEQIAGKSVDGRSDVFAVGIVLYELLAGRRPFQADNIAAVMKAILEDTPQALTEIDPGLDSRIWDAVRKALQKNPDDRQGSASEFAHDLQLVRYAHSATIPHRPLPSISGSADTGDQTETQPAARVTDLPPAVQTRNVSPLPEAPAATLVLPTTTPIPVEPDTVALPPPGPARVDEPNSGRQRAPLASRSRRRPTEQYSPPEPKAKPLDAPLAAQPALPRRKFPLRAQRTRDRFTITPERRNLWTGIAAVVVFAAGAALLWWRGDPRYRFEVRSNPVGAMVVIDGVDSGLRTPAQFALDSRPDRVTLRLDGYGIANASLPVTPPDTPIEVSLPRLPQPPVPAPGPPEPGSNDRGDPNLLPISTGSATGTRGGEANQVGTGRGQPVAKPPVIEVQRTLVTVRLTGGYPFEISGCERTMPPAVSHEFEVQAPCTLQLRSSKFLLNKSLPVTVSSGVFVDAAPQLARVQLRTAREKCKIVVDGRAVGPQPVDLELASGSHEIVMLCDDRNFTIPDFVVEPGNNIRRLDDFLP
jgi:serine/threonine protein kinase